MRTLLTILTVVLAGCGLVDESGEPNDAAPAAVTYQCESGRTIRATYTPPSLAVIEYEGRTVQMANVISGSGARYAGADLIWHTKGAIGVLSRSNTAGDLLESCTMASN